MDSTQNVTNVIIETINTIFKNLFSSIDNNLYNILDDITFINSNIISDSFFEKILGNSAQSGITLICNSLFFGFVLYYSIKYLFSHFYYSQIENPIHFIFKIFIFGLLINYSYFFINELLNFTSNITLAIRSIGENLFNKNICFSELISEINKFSSDNNSTLNIFSLEGIIKATISTSLLNLVFTYSFRYIMVKIFILLTPFAFLSLILENTSWFFKTWIRNLFALLFIQIIVSIVLLILFSIDYSSKNLITKFIYIGAIFALIKSNSLVHEFLGGVSTNISQNVNNLLKK